ncbi:hypothetical protein BCEP4_700009 [Burkholderia cepacia]|nr:hypothetical protein BCEP4_700009 [Burkholderia cepacia]
MIRNLTLSFKQELLLQGEFRPKQVTPRVSQPRQSLIGELLLFILYLPLTLDEEVNPYLGRVNSV